MSSQGAIVTGAASGIGLTLIKYLLLRGWRGVMADINPAGEALAQVLGENALFIKTDTSD
jgi:NAD(P)-dependent dehydrogenase (short-subunit alcohol dehydrogenase family)